MAEQSLDDLLVNGAARGDKGRFASPTPGEPEVAPKEPASEAVIAKPDPTPVPVAPVAVAPVAPVVPVESEKERAYQRGMLEERQKRQAAEARLRELESPPKPPVDPWQDLPGALQSQKEQLAEALFVQNCNLSERFARREHKDYDEVRNVFMEHAQSNPILFQQMRQAEDPATFAYSEGLRIRELKDVNGDFGAYRSKLETDIRAKVEAEFATKYGVKPVVVPTSLNSETSPAVTTEVYAGPPPLASILRNARS